MRQRRGMVLGAALTAALCLSGRASRLDLDAAMVGWAALGLVVLGGFWGASYARAKRARADWAGLSKGAKTARRGFFGQLWLAARWGAVILGVIWLAATGVRSGGS